MKKTGGIILFLILAMCSKLSAQSDNRISNFNSFWENTYYINPAAINTGYEGVFSMAARHQWTGFDGAPKSALATVARFFEPKQMQLGARVFTEKIGYTGQTSVAISYAYNVKFDYYWELRFGMAASYHNQYYDVSKISVQDYDDPLINSLKQVSQYHHYLNADFGVELMSKDVKLGASLKNLTGLFGVDKKIDFLKTDDLAFLSNVNYLYGMYRKHTGKITDMTIGAGLIHSGKRLQGEANMSFYFRLKENGDNFMQIGAFYRSVNEVGALVGIDLPDDWSAWRVLYSYDYNFSRISTSAWGTHEITLVYKWKKNPCVTCW